MKYRAAQTLVYSRAEGRLLGCNFLTRTVFDCDADLVAFLGGLNQWSSPGDIMAGMGHIAPAEAQEMLEQLVCVTALVEQGSALAQAEEDLRSEWKWGLPAALLHFCLQDPERIDLDESQAMQRDSLARGPAPSLYLQNDPGRAIRLADPRPGNALIELMARRRTVRSSAKPSIALDQLSRCLFAGMGITGQTTNGVVTLPLKMTPSGGARNPFEAYVYVREVDGLAPGFYHYSALDHDLAAISTNRMPKMSELVGGQEWADSMPCLILLCASLSRTMWKYSDPNGYRVVMIEAGHIGQNIMLAATQDGLSACPTGALSHTTIRECLSLTSLTDTPVYALALCEPGVEVEKAA